MLISECSNGLRVAAINDAFESYGVTTGTIGTINRVDYDDVRVTFDTETQGPVDLYVYPRVLRLADMSQITDADVFKREALKVMFEHKKINGWCGTAEVLACKMGLRDLLPVHVTVTAPVLLQVLRWPGESEDTIRARFAEQVVAITSAPYLTGHTFTEGEYVYTEDNGYTEDPTPEGETLDQFRLRLARVALKGARQYGVTGVPEFLRAVGIDPDSITETRTITATVQVEVEVAHTDTMEQYGRDLFTLALPSDVTIASVSVGR